MRIIGHRGASADAPENTLPAFQEAVRQGADGVELDAMVCGSGEVVVCHDETLERLAGVPLAVAKTPYARLRELDVGGRLGFPPARIPLLSEVLDALPPGFEVNVELKCDGADDRGLARKVAALLSERRGERPVVLSSFNPLCLLRARAFAPDVPRGQLLDPDRSLALQSEVFARLTGSLALHPHRSHCSAERVRRWRARGLSLSVWTVDAPEEARRLAALGVERCITNRPQVLREALEGAS